MCYDYDGYLAKARIAEQLRAKKRAAGDQEKQRDAPTPAAPRESEKPGKKHEPVPV